MSKNLSENAATRRLVLNGPDQEGTYGYRISNTKASSSRYGNCEICGEYVSEVFLQVEAQRFIDGMGDLSWTYHECKTLFGHEKCLTENRR